MRWLRMLPLLSLVAGFGCQNNTIAIDDDSDGMTNPGDTTTADPPTSDGNATTGGPDGPLTLHVVLSTPFDPSLPFQGIVSGAVNDAGTLDLTLQWLSLSPGSTTAPRQPIGDVYGYPGIAVEPDGSFVLETGILLIPGGANPVTGEDIVASLVFDADVSGDPTFCGAAGGVFTAPFEFALDGSTHSMDQVEGVAALPTSFPLGCP